MYILSTGCQWVALPKDLPPRSTVNDYFRRWHETAPSIAFITISTCNVVGGSSPALIMSWQDEFDLNSGCQ